MITNRTTESQADLSRKLGISRARVCQILRLLNLSPTMLNKLEELGNPLSSNFITERKLRKLVNTPAT